MEIENRASTDALLDRINELEGQLSEKLSDIRTSELTPRLAEDGEHIREYPAVHHDREPLERKLSFGTNVTVEPLSVSRENAGLVLATTYGYDAAYSMVSRAELSGEVINGSTFVVKDSTAKATGKWSVSVDRSREGAFVIWANILRQSGGRRK